MFNKELVKEAHRLAKEIKREYPEVNYSFQFGLNMKYLLSEIKGVEKVMIVLLGSEKQIAWGNDIKEVIGNVLEEALSMELADKKIYNRQKEVTRRFADMFYQEISAAKLIELFQDTFKKSDKDDKAFIAFRLRDHMDNIGQYFGLDEKEIRAVKGLLQKYNIKEM